MSSTLITPMALGSATPMRVSVKPRLRPVTYWETIVTSPGSTSVASSSPSTSFPPRKRSLASAYPANVVPTTLPTMTMAATTSELWA
jgi:hypothetical protein